MRILVLVQAYPSKAKPYNQAYVHARVLTYLRQGWHVDILSFACQESYLHEGVRVLPESALKSVSQVYDVWVSHAPNLRNHLRLILSCPQKWKKLVWVIHGHEVLIKQNYYPAPYPWLPQPSGLKRLSDRLYDEFKVWFLARCLRHWIPRNKIKLIFVSAWMKQAFLESVPLPAEMLKGVSVIIPNPAHPIFLNTEWSEPTPPQADFVTLRPLDEPKYAVDQVYQLAKNYPELKFDLYGQGRFFEFHPPLPNLRWFNRYCTQEEIPGILAQYRAALMPTRLDAQGVMVCEMASWGMPVLTSDLPICREMLKDFPRVSFFATPDNCDLPGFLNRELPPRGNALRFAPEETILQEIAWIARNN
ncbi:hypothetical protein COW36_22965 [bacterium (Candidatus Blackallbacteria) CG17_big_fil_post_rev_8_21_14_2_50_48_46]|uniref:Glycosyltransferase subfamily 4-like N-terminal domain-containing protein n=1 Tax=bacterium (Candidatus Blackallbacteria) CG17_big_fil_post_rev_8_21_14_2_50_48_46 TaxID=2014261 RepID=A0A2M7FY61_9BACT|nr:MAG: hypothetical protein COW64_16035 [bacterium (Candidatus Blackallbacteria) CG18_big_fil_WC_8_21_14_2_50_49_26]PIW14112.1 MAG: hypothetical protein COW36_22965 [bacterium (Candidatus Blackallbacteria) CG17_big_fil_post_rev_8_21_14_2_50_48_46]PIW45842.1 MAG: hypothetical protein COW20_18630 [bacterium (Candidatus Blackallbacteria) CG13_big_fil_rev_8_21_14_2_50_49_14]